jgi:hypothetical protein
MSYCFIDKIDIKQKCVQIALHLNIQLPSPDDSHFDPVINPALVQCNPPSTDGEQSE